MVRELDTPCFHVRLGLVDAALGEHRVGLFPRFAHEDVEIEPGRLGVRFGLAFAFSGRPCLRRTLGFGLSRRLGIRRRDLLRRGEVPAPYQIADLVAHHVGDRLVERGHVAVVVVRPPQRMEGQVVVRPLVRRRPKRPPQRRPLADEAGVGGHAADADDQRGQVAAGHRLLQRLPLRGRDAGCEERTADGGDVVPARQDQELGQVVEVEVDRWPQELEADEATRYAFRPQRLADRRLEGFLHLRL